MTAWLVTRCLYSFFFFATRMNIFIISLIIRGMRVKTSTKPQSFMLKNCTPNALAKAGTEITSNCKNRPNTIEPIRYLFLNNPTWKIDFVLLRIESE